MAKDSGYSDSTPVEQRGWGNTLILLSFMTFISACILYVTRRHWLPAWHALTDRIFRRNSNYSFIQDAELGMSSQSFNLASNITSDDSRGLDTQATREIKRLMKRHKLTFDQARERYTTSRFQDQGLALMACLPIQKRWYSHDLVTLPYRTGQSLIN